MKQRKRIAAFALAAAMVFSTLPMSALAVESPPDAGGLCEHHTEHTEDCGYTPGIPGTECTHEHDAGCGYSEGTPEIPCSLGCTETGSDGAIIHQAGCAYAPAVEGSLCQHEHDDTCGYSLATDGTPCTYVCEICNPQDSGNAGQKPDGGAQEHCSCITLCTEGNNNPDCPICGAEGADLSACKGKAEQEEKCTCTVLCTEDTINTDCPVCGAEGVDLTLCVGKVSSDVIDEAVTAVQEQIDALPTAEELQAMSAEEQQEVYTKLQTAYDAYKALTDEQKEQITGAEIFDSLFDVFNGMTALAADDTGFTIEGSGSYTYENGVLTIQDEADLTISTSGQTSHRIVVAENAEATITLNGVHIVGESATSGADPFSAIDIANNASLLLQLTDGSTNSLTGGNGETGDGAPGIHVPEEAELTILGSGSLTVAGGTGGYGGSGIGGTHVPGPNLKAETCGTVIILATGEISISGGESGPGSSPGNDIGGGKGPPEQAGGDGGGIRPTGDGSYVVWGEPTLPNPPSSYTIPEGATLTVPGDAALCIPSGVTLTNNGTITGEGNLNGDGILTGSGVVTVRTNNFQKTSALTLTIEGSMILEGGPYVTAYDSTITLKAKVEQTNTRALSAGDYNTVTFYVGTGDSKRILDTVKVENNEASLTNIKISTEQGWVIGQNTITAEFTGHSHLKPATGTATLTVGKGLKPNAPNAPSDVSDVTATSVTLEPLAGSDVKGDIQYGYITGTEISPSNWQSSTTFENLTPATAYTFYTRYMENDFFMPSPASDTGLKVITAPAADAVTINYINEKITFDDGKLEVNSNKEFSNTPLSNNGTVTSRIGQKIYVRVKSENDANTPIRGITEIDVPVRPASPENPKVANVSAAGQQDGKILNLTPNADYQISTDETIWANHTTDADGVISNLAAGTYKVRTKATPTQFASASASVTIGVGNIITIIPPTFEPVYVGYDQPAPKQITIQNSGDQDVTLTSLSKTAGETFTVQGSGALNSVVPAGGSNTSFTVQPGEGWGVGEHTAIITAEYGNGQTASATVRFVVQPRPYDEDDGGSSGSSYRDREYDFWQEVREQIEDADSGDIIKVNARGYDRMSWTVMEALRKSEDITLIIRWNGGEDITIHSTQALKESSRIYYPLSYLESYGFGKLPQSDPSKVNPETGGIWEVNAPAEAVFTQPNGTPEVTAPQRGLAESPELAQQEIEKAVPGVYEPEAQPVIDHPTQSESDQGNSVLPIALAVVLVAGAAFFLWKKGQAKG